jgi:TetR/AcrR family transcriptional regulator
MSDGMTRDPDATRARILEAAFDQFVDHGFSKVAMREIAEHSGVTKSLIHHHFGTKQQLWEAVKDHAFGLYAEEQRAELENAERPDTDLLSRGVVNYFRFLRDNPQVVRLMAWTHLEGDTSCGKMDAELVRLGAERVRQGQRAGIFRGDVNPTHVVTTFVLTCLQWFEAHAHHAQWSGIGSDEEFLDDFLKIFMRGIAPAND